MRVKLSPLQLEDQGAYSCEITYEEPGRWFKDSCLDPQLTMLNVLGKPDKVIVSMVNETELDDEHHCDGSNIRQLHFYLLSFSFTSPLSYP